jgi:hypothetical protein
MSGQKKLTFADLQPHVEMLCDAVENKGASSSGLSHGAYECAQLYRNLLQQARDKSITYNQLSFGLYETKMHMLKIAGCQHYRLSNLADALDIYIKKEYNKQINSEK